MQLIKPCSHPLVGVATLQRLLPAAFITALHYTSSTETHTRHIQAASSKLNLIYFFFSYVRFVLSVLVVLRSYEPHKCHGKHTISTCDNSIKLLKLNHFLFIKYGMGLCSWAHRVSFGLFKQEFGLEMGISASC